MKANGSSITRHFEHGLKNIKEIKHKEGGAADPDPEELRLNQKCHE